MRPGLKCNHQGLLGHLYALLWTYIQGKR